MNWVLDVNGNHGVPACISRTFINNGGTAQISTTTQTAEACETFLGENSGQSGNLSVDHGTLHTCNELHVGYGGNGKLIITNGGVVSTTFAADMAAVAGSNSSATVDAINSQWTIMGGGVLYVAGTINGDGGTGLLTVTNSATVTAGSVHVYKSGTLTGNGTVSMGSGSGTATVDGTVAPNGGGGTLTLGGALQLNSGATTQCKVTPQDPSTTPQVSVSAQVSLGGRLSVTMTGDFSSAPTRFTLLSADSVAVGHITFGSTSITYPTGQGCWIPQITYDYTGGHVHVYVDRVINCN